MAHSNRLGALPLELLELILGLLPMRDLLLSQRVCHKWRSLISSSPALQEALFLRPAAGPFSGWKRTYTAAKQIERMSKTTFERTMVERVEDGVVRFKGDLGPPKPTVNYLGLDWPAYEFLWYDGEGPFTTSLLDDPERDREVEYAERDYVRGAINPLLWRISDYYDPDATVNGFLYVASDLRIKVSEKDRDLNNSITTFSHYWRELLDSDSIASWRRMFLTQPPAQRLWVPKPSPDEDEPSPWGSHVFETAVYTADTNITMGDLVDELNRRHGTRRSHWKHAVFRSEGIVDPLPQHLRALEIAMAKSSDDEDSDDHSASNDGSPLRNPYDEVVAENRSSDDEASDDRAMFDEPS